jgi:methyl-accepting chemotaxis protein
MMKIFSDLWIEDLSEFSNQIEEMMRCMSKIFVSIHLTEEMKGSGLAEENSKLIIQLKDNSSKIEGILTSIGAQSEEIMKRVHSLHQQNEEVSKFSDKKKLECLQQEIK